MNIDFNKNGKFKKTTHAVAFLVEVFDVPVNLKFDEDFGMYWSLDSQTKSHIHINEWGQVKMRYDKTHQIDYSKDNEQVLKDIAELVYGSMCGREFINESWKKFMMCFYPELEI